MHYYKLNISDWIADLSYLSPLEEGIYLRLINHYYDKEKPIPEDFKTIARKLRLSEYLDEIKLILNDFFFLTEKGWENKRCNENIKEFKKKSNKNKLNGAKGGRPSKTKVCNETQTKPSGLILETQQEPKHNPNITLTTNHKPPTKNHKPIKDNVEFDKAWLMYEKKGNKKTSQSRFNQLSKNKVKLLFKYLPIYVKSTPDLQFRKDFQSYILLECWNDKIVQSNNKTDVNFDSDSTDWAVSVADDLFQ